MEVAFIFFEKMLEMYYLFLCIYVQFVVCFKEYSVIGIFFVMNGNSTILCLISVIWKICLKAFVKSLVCSIVRVGIIDN